MKFFVDTADTAEIAEMAETGLLDGVTTNPSLIAKSGRDFLEVTKEICALVDGPVSAEVISLDHAGMMREAEILRPVIDEIENATDALEDCAFFVSIAPHELDRSALAALAGVVIESTSALVRGVEAASRLPRGQRADAMAALQAIDAVEAIGVDADKAAPDHWRHVHNRLSVGQEPRAYTRAQHKAWLLRRRAQP